MKSPPPQKRLFGKSDGKSLFWILVTFDISLMTNFTYITFWKVPICKICGETATGLFSGRSSRLPTCEQAAPSPFCDWHCQKAFSVRPQWQINTYLLETGKTVTNNSPPPRGLICFLGELCEHPSEHKMLQSPTWLAPKCPHIQV